MSGSNRRKNQPATGNVSANAKQSDLATNVTEKHMEDDTVVDGTEKIMAAINGMRDDFNQKLAGVMVAIQDVKKDITDFSGRISEAEQRISDAEDSLNTLQASKTSLEKGVATLNVKLEGQMKQVEMLTSKLQDQEDRNRRNNLRFLNLPENAEGRDAVGFLEKWLPEALGAGNFTKPIVVERAHRIQSKGGSNFPRVLIARFLNSSDKDRVTAAARAKGKVMFEGREVMFFQDVSNATAKKRKGFDDVKKTLRDMNIQYGMMHPAKLRVTHDGKTEFFDNPGQVKTFIMNIKA